MRTFVVLAVILSSGFAAPTLDTIEDNDGLLRAKKSSHVPVQSHHHHHHETEDLEGEHKARAYYDSSLGGLSAGAGAYGAGVGLSIAAPAAAPISAGGYSGASALNTNIGLASAGASYAPAAHSLAYSGASGLGAGSIGLGAGSVGLGASGPAVGIFPSAHIGGCNVPLLLSCAPNIVAGHLSVPHHQAYAAPAYRSFEDDTLPHHEWARKASHHKVSEDFPENHGSHHGNHQGSHHVVSQDYPEPNLTRVTPVLSHNDKVEKMEKN